MLGLRALSDMPNLPPVASLSVASSTFTTSNTYKTVFAMARDAAQLNATYGGPDPNDTVNAMLAGPGAPIIFKEEAADSLATSTRVVRVITAQIPIIVTELALVMDTTVIPSPADYVYFQVKTYANGASIGSAVSASLSSAFDPFTARTKRAFQWVGFLALAAGETLVVEETKVGLGVAVPKFEIVGATRLS